MLLIYRVTFVHSNQTLTDIHSDRWLFRVLIRIIFCATRHTFPDSMRSRRCHFARSYVRTHIIIL